MIQRTINGFQITISVEEVTPEIAKHWLQSANNKNRHINKQHVNALVRNMNNSTWRFNGDTICFDAEGTLIDGQHRLAAICQCNKTIDAIIVRGLNPEAIKTKDFEVRPRRLSDLLSMDGVQQAVQKAAIVIRYILLTGDQTIIAESSGIGGEAFKSCSTLDEKYDTYYRYQLLFDEYCSYACRLAKHVKYLSISELAGICVYLYIELNHSDEQIRGFFDRLFGNANDINIINALREKLIKNLCSSTPYIGSVKQSLIAKTWNCYISGKGDKTSLIYNLSKEGKIKFI